MNNGTCLRQGYMRLLVVCFLASLPSRCCCTRFGCACALVCQGLTINWAWGPRKGGSISQCHGLAGQAIAEAARVAAPPGPTTRRHRVGEDCGWRVSVLDITRSVAGRCGRAGSRPRAPNLPWPGVKHTLAQEKTKRTTRGKGGSPECPWA